MSGVPTATLREDFVAALLARDGTHARHLITRAVDDGTDVRDIYLEVLAPAMHEIGERWADCELGIAGEHYATAITQGLLGALGPRVRRPPDGGRLAVLSCTPGELHTLGLQMVGDLLEAAAWEVLPLGASTPPDALVDLVADEQPDAVVLSTATSWLLPDAVACVERLARLVPRPFVVVGGRGWQPAGSEHAARAGADACLDDAARVATVLTERFPALPDE